MEQEFVDDTVDRDKAIKPIRFYSQKRDESSGASPEEIRADQVASAGAARFPSYKAALLSPRKQSPNSTPVIVRKLGKRSALSPTQNTPTSRPSFPKKARENIPEPELLTDLETLIRAFEQLERTEFARAKSDLSCAHCHSFDLTSAGVSGDLSKRMVRRSDIKCKSCTRKKRLHLLLGLAGKTEALERIAEADKALGRAITGSEDAARSAARAPVVQKSTSKFIVDTNSSEMRPRAAKLLDWVTRAQRDHRTRL